MSLSWQLQRVKNNVPARRRTHRPMNSQRRRSVRLTVEALEDRILLNAPTTTGAVLQLTGSVFGLVTEMNEAYDDFTSTPQDIAGGIQHSAYAAGNAMNLTGNILAVAGVQGSSGPALKLAGDATHLMGALGHIGATGLNPGDALDADSDLIAVSGDITGFFSGEVPKLISDSLGTLHDGINFLHDGVDKGWLDPATVGDLFSLSGDIVSLIGDALGDDAGTLPLQVYASNVNGATDFNFAGQVAIFSDPNKAGGTSSSPGDYSALINWGDGSSSAGQIVPDGTGSYSVVGSHTYAAQGDYPLSIAVAGDGTQGQSQADATIAQDIESDSVMDAYPNAIYTGQTFNDALITFRTNAQGSQDEQSYAATINWGDGTTSAGQFACSNGRIQVVGSHLYAGPGEYSVNVQVTAPDGSSISGSTTVSVVSPYGLAASRVDVSSSGLTYSGPVATFFDTDGDSNPADYSATIYWGDDSPTSSGQIVANGNGTFSVVATHTYAQPGIYVLPNVNIGDADGFQDTAYDSTVTAGTMSLTANNITAPAGLSFTTTVANFTWPDASAPASSFAVGVDWGDGTASSSADVDGDVQVVANGGGSYSVVATHTYGGSGSYSVQVSVGPPSGDTALTASSTAAVGAASLTVTAETLFISPGPSEAVSLSKLHADSSVSGGSVKGTVASFTAPSGASASDYTATINWGDGNTSTGQIVANPNGTFNVVGSHTYSQLEGYLTSVQVNDTNGNVASAFGKVSPPPPSSSVNPLPATVNSPSFTVSWSGSDPYGPGIASYTIYVSDNGGAFTPWLTNTTQTSATFIGQAGHSYGFYSVATDQLGLTQPAPTAAQATTSVQSPGNNSPGGNNPGNNNPGNNHPGPQQKPATPEVPSLLAFINQVLAEVEAVNSDSTTITDSLFGMPLVVEVYDYFGHLASLSLFGINIPSSWFSYLGL